MFDQSQPKRFLWTATVFTPLFYLMAVLGILGYMKINDSLVSPALTGSPSFDEKIVWLTRHLTNSCDILAVGSSMTLTNINSRAVTAAFPGQSFINAASWGMRLQDDEMLIRLLQQFCTPKILLISTYMGDFRFGEPLGGSYSESDLKNFLTSHNALWAHIKYFSLPYYWDLGKTIHERRSNGYFYDTLIFDAHGGAPISHLTLDADWKKKVFRSRWFEDPTFPVNRMNEKNYEALKAIARFAREKHIVLVVAQPPIRKQALSYDLVKQRLDWHLGRIRQIASESGFVFYDGHAAPGFKDALFLDSTHLNEKGAIKYTLDIIRNLLQSRAAHVPNTRAKP